MTTDLDFYDCLGIGSSASGSTIRRAYNRLAKTHHPDKTGGGPDTSRFQAIQVAYETLSDPVRRRAYDALSNLTIELSLSEAVFGTTVHIRGGVDPLVIPPGTVHGDVVRSSVRVHVRQDARFGFRNGQLWTRRSISLWEALVGFRFHFKTLSGTRSVVVSEPYRIYQPGDVVTVLDEQSTVVNIQLEIRYPKTFSKRLYQTIESEKKL